MARACSPPRPGSCTPTSILGRGPGKRLGRTQAVVERQLAAPSTTRRERDGPSSRLACITGASPEGSSPDAPFCLDAGRAGDSSSSVGPGLSGLQPVRPRFHRDAAQAHGPPSHITSRDHEWFTREPGSPRSNPVPPMDCEAAGLPRGEGFHAFEACLTRRAPSLPTAASRFAHIGRFPQSSAAALHGPARRGEPVGDANTGSRRRNLLQRPVVLVTAGFRNALARGHRDRPKRRGRSSRSIRGGCIRGSTVATIPPAGRRQDRHFPAWRRHCGRRLRQPAGHTAIARSRVRRRVTGSPGRLRPRATPEVGRTRRERQVAQEGRSGRETARSPPLPAADRLRISQAPARRPTPSGPSRSAENPRRGLLPEAPLTSSSDPSCARTWSPALRAERLPGTTRRTPPGHGL